MVKGDGGISIEIWRLMYRYIDSAPWSFNSRKVPSYLKLLFLLKLQYRVLAHKLLRLCFMLLLQSPQPYIPVLSVCIFYHLIPRPHSIYLYINLQISILMPPSPLTIFYKTFTIVYLPNVCYLLPFSFDLSDDLI